MAGKTFRMPPLPPLVKKPATVDYTSGGEGAAVVVQAIGFKSLEEYLLAIPKHAQDAAGFEMANIMADVIEVSRDVYVPYKFGPLRDSSGSDEYKPGSNLKGGGITEIRAWYGAPLSAIQIKKGAHAAREGFRFVDPSIYAADQHENLSYNHPVVGPVSQPQAKYLERPFNEAEPTILGRIASAVSAALGGSPTQDQIISDVNNVSQFDSIIESLTKAPDYPGYGSRK